MKLRIVFVLLIMFYFIFGISWATIYLVSSGQESFSNQVEDYLVSVIDVNEERINDFILEMEDDVLFLAESEKTKDLLKSEFGESSEAAKIAVAGKIKIVVKEVDNYLRAHPNMSLRDLQESSEFQRIAVQAVGEFGYTALHGRNTNINYFHVNSDIVGTSLGDLFVEFPELMILIEEVSEKGSSEGYYDWRDLNGRVRRKYGEFQVVPTETLDGVKLVAAATAYVDDYITVKNISEDLDVYFKNFNEIRDYHNVLLISPKRNVVYMSKLMEGYGGDIDFSSNDLKKLDIMLDNLKRGEVGYYGPFIRQGKLQVAVFSRVYNVNEYIGIIIILKGINKINKILKEDSEVKSGERDEDYLVNKNGLLITPIRNKNVDIMIQEVKTENVESCTEDFSEAEKLNMTVEQYAILEKDEGLELALFPFQNIEGDLTYGLHRPIGKVEWCLVSEVSVEEVLSEPMEMSFKEQIMFRLWLFFVVVLMMVGGSLFIDKRWVLKKKKKVFRGNFFTRLSLWYYLLFAIIFAVIYSFIVTLFFQGWLDAKLFDVIPDMLVFVVGFMIFAVGLKIKKIGVRGYVIFGGGLILLGRMSMILVKEYQFVSGGHFLSFLWIPILVAEFLGFVLLLIGYGRLKDV